MPDCNDKTSGEAETFRFPPPPAGTPPAVVEAGHLAYSIIASVTGAYQTCPRRECRDGCAADRKHTCKAEFPAVATDMATAMQLFLLAIPYETALRLHALDARSRGRQLSPLLEPYAAG